jgi:hypothetical protein
MFTTIPGEGHPSRGMLRKFAHFLKELIRVCTVAHTASLCQERKSVVSALLKSQVPQAQRVRHHKHRADCPITQTWMSRSLFASHSGGMRNRASHAPTVGCCLAFFGGRRTRCRSTVAQEMHRCRVNPPGRTAGRSSLNASAPLFPRLC